MNTVDNFNFWCPVAIEKAINQETGEEIMRLGGIASTADEDSDGEFLDPKGFDIKPLLESGMVNWHHQAKNNPGTIVGEPTKAEIRKDGLYIETDLYPSSQVAREIWELAKTLDTDSKTRRLGYSIEGRVLERKSNDKTSKDYKKITKAIITGVAITHMPKNPKTFANIIKGDIEDTISSEGADTTQAEKEEEFYEETGIKEKKDKKGLSTDKGRALIKEDLDKKVKVTTFGKAEVYEKIFENLPGISIIKATKVYTLIQKISNMANKKQITEDDIQKAFETLGLEPEDNVTKGNEATQPDEDASTETDDQNDSEEDVSKGGKDNPVEDEEDVDTDDDDTTDDDTDDDEDEKVTKAMMDDRFDRIEKALVTSHINNAKYMKALGVMIKASSNELQKASEALTLANERINKLTELNKAQESTINSLSSRLEEFGNFTPAPKSLRHAAPVERAFNKGNGDELNKGGETLGENQVSILNKAAVSEILDEATFANGFDEEFSKACMAYEASGTLTPNVISRIKKEYGIEIIK